MSDSQPADSNCYFCRKNMGIMVFNCKCGYKYCKKHRLPEQHECTYDHKMFGKETLRMNNPKIVGEKIIEI
ncbi:AN1-like zinc finger [Tetraselmis virus 1]|uniref:AN1-like zinc finger n=1 Tax=Tetraselmis virus 1 TaxID=2060617 RepID=A0A2P0VNR4_9VIRU|nr:AN1-like zinc finger [Tetraselmis virus 1]AUF82544.1 AN1-like zinc finger [Tetraselmis virus 1]